MSDYHVLQTTDALHEITAVLHVPVPDENNAAGRTRPSTRPS